jgi:hypothetical protein
MSTAKSKRPGSGVRASPGTASLDQRQSAGIMKPLAPDFKNLKARLDAYSEHQLDEMDKYQKRKVI